MAEKVPKMLSYLAGFAGPTRQPARPVLGADRFHQAANARNAHYPFHVVTQDVQRHFGTDMPECFPRSASILPDLLPQQIRVEYVMAFAPRRSTGRFSTSARGRRKLPSAPGSSSSTYGSTRVTSGQKRRFEARTHDPLRQWRGSAGDLPSRSKCFEYSRARDPMFEATDAEWAPGCIPRSDDKKRARLNRLAHILSLIPYKEVPREKMKLPERSMRHPYDDEATLKGRNSCRKNTDVSNSAQNTGPSAAAPVHRIPAAARLSIYRKEWFCFDLSAGQRGCL